ncbi:MAG: hypothetical protein ACK5VV_04130 [Lysobacteraceae bacterium]|jgi:hypothetical protein|nr:hypothetical protein [Xanthomonadaceae bacterium]MCZ8318629.1 hypothetical protein [Silanimonas sp.]
MRRVFAVGMVLAAGLAAAVDAPAPALRFDGRSTGAFEASLAAMEAGMGDAARLTFHMRLAQARAKLAEQRGRPLTDAEFATALDGKTVAEFDALADTAPTHITIDIETSDDT